jgi:predicted transglutaminase-like cysteine proteinase
MNTVIVSFLVVGLAAFSGGTNVFADDARVTSEAIASTHNNAKDRTAIQQHDNFQTQAKMAAVDRAGLSVKSPALAEPFGLNAVPVATRELSTKWISVEADIRAESEILVHCRENPEDCPSTARTFLAIVAEGRARTGRARIGVINRAINLAIRGKSDFNQWGVEDRWTAPLATLTSGSGDCEDYAIAKYVALTEAGVAVEDVRLVIVRDLAIDAGHAVVAVRLEDGWVILDNRRQTLVEDREMRRVIPLFVLDRDGVKQFAPVATPDLPYIGALRTHDAHRRSTSASVPIFLGPSAGRGMCNPCLRLSRRPLSFQLKCGCLLLAQSRHPRGDAACPLSGVKRDIEI